MLCLGGKSQTPDAGRKLFADILASGEGFKKIKHVAIEQEADAKTLDHYADVTQAKYTHEFRAARNGWLAEVHPREIGFGLVDLGAGRRTADDPVDHTAGIVFEKQRGDQIKSGDLLATACWSRNTDETDAGLRRIEAAFDLGDKTPDPRTLIQFRID
jgi:pyrimidine-nucleoside phosphorylase